MKIKHETGIPIPARTDYGPVRAVLKSLKVGESLWVDEPINQSLLYQKLKPRRFVVRRVNGGWRIWRSE